LGGVPWDISEHTLVQAFAELAMFVWNGQAVITRHHLRVICI